MKFYRLLSTVLAKPAVGLVTTIVPAVFDVCTSFPAYCAVATAVVVYEALQTFEMNEQIEQLVSSTIDEVIIQPTIDSIVPRNHTPSQNTSCLPLDAPNTVFDSYLNETINDTGAYIGDPFLSSSKGITNFVCALPTNLKYSIDGVDIEVEGRYSTYTHYSRTYKFVIMNVTSGTYWRHHSTFSQFVECDLTSMKYDLILAKITVTKTVPFWYSKYIHYLSLSTYTIMPTAAFNFTDLYNPWLGCYILHSKGTCYLYHKNCVEQLKLSTEEFVNFLQLRSSGKTAPSMFSAVRHNADEHFYRLCALYDRVLPNTMTTIQQETLVYGVRGTMFEKTPGTLMPDLLGTTVVADQSKVNEAECIRKRLQLLRVDGYDENIPEFLLDFVTCMTDTVFSSLRPIPLEDFIEDLKPNVRSKYLITAQRIAYTYEHEYPLPGQQNSSFIKTESYEEKKPPRNISAVATAHVLSYSSYTRAISAHLKNYPCYAFGSSPRVVASTVYNICVAAKLLGNPVIETDFSKFDGTQGSFCKAIEIDILDICFPNDEKARAYHAEVINASFRTRCGIHYKTDFTRLSGSADTSVFNTCINMYVNYLALRLTGYNHEMAIDVVLKHGIFGGDDGLIMDVGQGPQLEKTMAMLGMSIKSTRRNLHKDPVTFLGRVYPFPCLSPDSFQDVNRFLNKLSFSDCKSHSIDELYARKLLSFYHTDKDNAIGKFALTYLLKHSTVRFKVPENIYHREDLRFMFELDNKQIGEILHILDTTSRDNQSYPSMVDDETIYSRLAVLGYSTNTVSNFINMLELGDIIILQSRDIVEKPKDDYVYEDSVSPPVIDIVAQVKEHENVKLQREAFFMSIAKYIIDHKKILPSTNKLRASKLCCMFNFCQHKDSEKEKCTRDHIDIHHICPYNALSNCKSRTCPYVHIQLSKWFRYCYLKNMGLQVILPASDYCSEHVVGHKCSKLYNLPLCNVQTHLTQDVGCKSLHLIEKLSSYSLSKFCPGDASIEKGLAELKTNLDPPPSGRSAYPVKRPFVATPRTTGLGSPQTQQGIFPAVRQPAVAIQPTLNSVAPPRLSTIPPLPAHF